jgi:tellurite resistance protein
MSIAIDQTRLRRIVERLAPGLTLTRDEGETILQIAQLAAGADEESHPQEHAVLQQVAQHIGSAIGIDVGELHMIPKIPDEEARAGRLERLANRLDARRTKDLAYTFAFLVSIADLELVPAETKALEEFQLALGVSDRRAMDLVVMLSEIIEGGHAPRPHA